MTQDPTKLAALAVALGKAQQAARPVEKDARNAFHNYKYASAENIIEEGRTALMTAGLSLLQTDVRIETRQGPPPPPAKGEQRSTATEPVAVVRVTYVLLHQEGGMLTWDREWFAVLERGRPLDKAEAGALTTGLAYALRDLLLLPRDDEQAAIDRRDDSGYGAPPPPPPPPPAHLPPPPAPEAAPPPPPPPPAAPSNDWVSPPAVAQAEAASGPDAQLAVLRQTLASSHSTQVVEMLVAEALRLLPPAYAEQFKLDARARWEAIAPLQQAPEAA